MTSTLKYQHLGPLRNVNTVVLFTMGSNMHKRNKFILRLWNDCDRRLLITWKNRFLLLRSFVFFFFLMTLIFVCNCKQPSPRFSSNRVGLKWPSEPSHLKNPREPGSVTLGTVFFNVSQWNMLSFTTFCQGHPTRI